MGNPCRYFWKNKISCKKPQIKVDPKEVEIQFVNTVPDDLKDAYIDFYSAPDVIFKYVDGGDNRGEFRRYNRFYFKGLKEIDRIDEWDLIRVRYSYQEYYDACFQGLEQMRHVPLGKFCGMDESQIIKYVRKKFPFQDRTEQSKEPELKSQGLLDSLILDKETHEQVKQIISKVKLIADSINVDEKSGRIKIKFEIGLSL